MRDGAAEGGGGGAGGAGAAAGDDETGRWEDHAPATPLHAPVVRRRQRRGGAEAGGGGGGERRRRRGVLPVLRVARRLHREHPQEPGLRDHLRPPRHGGVRDGGGGGVDDGELAVQEAGNAGDRGGGRGVPRRGRRRRRVRVGVQRAHQDRPDVHAGLQRLRRLAHRQHRRGSLLRGRAAGLVRRRMNRRHQQFSIDRNDIHV
uniref:Uncharacterized protein n=1 Tax=Oryza barthii TaxID=65489 RepID=A0A0D3G059_9ORYZ